MVEHIHGFGISASARQLGCAESTVRDLERRGVISPRRDSAGRRQLSQADLDVAREYLARPRTLAGQMRDAATA